MNKLIKLLPHAGKQQPVNSIVWGLNHAESPGSQGDSKPLLSCYCFRLGSKKKTIRIDQIIIHVRVSILTIIQCSDLLLLISGVRHARQHSWPSAAILSLYQ